ncbi:G5 domain-containing protein [uncultured Levyella sp.]|uniref:G5 domain-containing protein n=1 Tax=uncultured Levyella sp. TaxID=1715800 RepID=UPI0025845746|nr:G5 domain-containing protein [uncultured Levyella sp.]
MKKHSSRRGRALILAGVLMMSAVAGGFVYAQRPKVVHVTYNNEQRELVTSKETLGDALKDARYADLADAKISMDLNHAVKDGMNLEILTKKKITFYNGGKAVTRETYASTVGSFLTENNIDPDQDDVIQPARTEDLHKGDTVRVDYYETQMVTENTPLDFKTLTKNTDDLNIGKSKVQQKGEKGNRQTVTKTILKNGQVAEKQVVSDQVTKQPVEEIILKGTHDSSPRSPQLYTLSQFRFQGVVYYGGYKYTFYSQSVLPGGGLYIPGRHINASGYVVDGDGYIVLAGSAAKGTVFPTPFGHYGKIYDRGTSGNHLDVYVR